MNPIEITSEAFREGARIPDEFTCKGANLSPPISFGPMPPGTKSIVVICDDPDAPSGLFTHWILYNIPAGTEHISKGVPKKPVLIDGSRHGTNSYGRMEYSGPACPPGTTHHYHFDAYALDMVLALRAPVTRRDIGHAMEGHILGNGSLIGLFSR
ncbi:MAG: YbhB/YbcL family Raf kinase inhibitor-like protein [Methanomicrobiales archaeon]|jgi:Raf kinase inhibitor-like YbhB/YbcL family protein|nr:YbhB/YbcL family Raf kinase inhibitor-like protein [Burkholderiaceae bacterium]NLH26378.1 YbhB/YbcL family Raf kinase inhibitor-like protein [Methanomicrobiales archaeon]HMZ32287.1 YbhB/YbcL family Raf kinase inhibitor-like protein [Methanoregulaceae archaeon]HNJ81484.1 YbhB/YbcL family Raf kinase inhibitor-like protein [Methanoregulaceae archaeon]HNO08378.1 YbhB/YbcL family Raf kinase inhibitor-like protein [Methanoregulaceae archaeon]